MAEIISTEVIKNEINELTTFVRYGTERLEDFLDQLQALESGLGKVQARADLDELKAKRHKLAATIQATGTSLLEWQDKANLYLSHLHQWVQQQQGPITEIDPVAAEEEITELLKMISGQLKRVQQLSDKLESFNSDFDAKKLDLKPKFERGKEPVLTDEVSEVV